MGEGTRSRQSGSFGRMLVWALAIFAALVVILVVIASQAGDVSPALQYEGFD